MKARGITALALLSLVGCEAERVLHTAPYVILTNIAEGDGYHRAVARLRDHRGARVVMFDPSSPAASREELRRLAPRHVAIVVKPGDLDVNLARRVLMLSTELDDDPFADFAYGFITGATADDALAFVDNIIRAEREGVAGKDLSVGGIFNVSATSGMLATTAGFLAPLAASDAAIALSRDDPAAASYFAQKAGAVARRRALVIAYQGGPHMLWLFSTGTKPWGKYDPKRVESPPVKLAGVDSAAIGKLDLYPSVVFGAMSHGGAVKRVLVGSGLAQTFGEVDGTIRFYEMGPSFSFALAVLRAGAIGYFAAIGRTNGFFNDEALYHAFRYDEPLGEIHKRGLDMLVMGFLGNRPRLKLYSAGDADLLGGTLESGSYRPQDFASSYLISFLANRVYLGDPALSPFTGVARSDRLRLVKTTSQKLADGSLQLEVAFDKPKNVSYPVDDQLHGSGVRIYTTVPLPAALGDGVKVELTKKDPVIPVQRVIHAVERRRDGERVLHLELDVTAQNSVLEAIAFRATLEVARR